MTNVTRIVENTVGFIDELRAATNESLNASAESFENILGSLYPITFACYHSIFEYGEVAVLYGETIADGLQLVYNLIHKLGNIYDCIYFLVKHHRSHPGKIYNEETEEKEDIILPSLEDIPEDDEDAIEAAQAEIDEYTSKKEEWWFKLGIYYGTLIYLFFYTPENYDTNGDWDPTEDIDNTVQLIATKGLQLLTV